jgi:hypothetical protein
MCLSRSEQLRVVNKPNHSVKGVSMKKRTVLFAVAMCLVMTAASSAAGSSGSCYGKGDMTVQGGLGLLYESGFGIADGSPVGIDGSFDYGVHDMVSVGGSLGIAPIWGFHLSITGRGAFHPFNLPVLADKVKIRDKLDPYVGLALGWHNQFWDEYRFGFLASPILGARWYFNPKLGVFAEFGGVAWLSGGIAFKF